MHYRPATKQELYNLRHASARNVVERIFGIVKKRFRILLLAPEFDMDIQTHIPRVLCALHNFIRRHDPTDANDEEYALAADVSHVRVNGPGIGELATNTVNAAERMEASNARDQIAEQMWEDYQQILHDNGHIVEDIPN